MKNDQNFDTHSKTFGKNIYGTSKGKVRQAVLMRDLNELLKDKTALNILDVGGGQGQIAVELAKLGHKVTLTDISEEMLEQAKMTADNDLAIEFIHAPLQELDQHLSQKFDLVLCHAVFEWLELPFDALKTLKQFTTDSGVISLMFFNRTAQVMSNLVYGNFDYIEAGLKTKKVVKLNPQSALEPNDVFDWCKTLELQIDKKTGVRCFHDYMRDINHWQDKLDDIIKMELKYSEQEPYASIGRYMHLLLTHNNTNLGK